MARETIRPDWASKTFAGVVFGTPLALALAGIFAWVGPGGIGAPQKSQFVMWSIAPVWMAVLSTVWLFKSGRRALLVLGLADVAAFALLAAVRHVGGAP